MLFTDIVFWSHSKLKLFSVFKISLSVELYTWKVISKDHRLMFTLIRFSYLDISITQAEKRISIKHFVSVQCITCVKLKLNFYDSAGNTCRDRLIRMVLSSDVILIKNWHIVSKHCQFPFRVPVINLIFCTAQCSNNVCYKSWMKTPLPK